MQQFEVQQRVERELKTPTAIFDAAQFANGTFLSGHLTSGLSLVSVASPVKLRLLNISMFNKDVGFVSLEFRDGSVTGNLVSGPFKVLGDSEKRISYDECLGQYFTSGIHICHTSGFSHSATPVSNGIVVGVSFLKDVLEPVT